MPKIYQYYGNNPPVAVEDLSLTNVNVDGRVGVGTTNASYPLQVGSGTTVVVVTGIGSIGIGTTNPTSKLHVVGNALITGIATVGSVGIATIRSSQPVQVGSGTTVVVVDNLGDLGIGTTNPREKLDVIGNAIVTGITSSLSYTTSGTTTSTDATTATFTIDASTTQLYHHSASFNGNKTFQVSNLTNGRSVYLYLRNTNASSRTISIQASTTASGFASVELSRSGAVSVNSFTIAASTGTAVVWVVNIGGNLVGSLT